MLTGIIIRSMRRRSRRFVASSMTMTSPCPLTALRASSPSAWSEFRTAAFPGSDRSERCFSFCIVAIAGIGIATDRVRAWILKARAIQEEARDESSCGGWTRQSAYPKFKRFSSLAVIAQLPGLSAEMNNNIIDNRVLVRQASHVSMPATVAGAPTWEGGQGQRRPGTDEIDKDKGSRARKRERRQDGRPWVAGFAGPW